MAHLPAEDGTPTYRWHTYLHLLREFFFVWLKQTAVKSTTMWDNWLRIFLDFPIPVMKLSGVKRNHSCKTLITDQCHDNTLMKLSTQKHGVTCVNMINPFH